MDPSLLEYNPPNFSSPARSPVRPHLTAFNVNLAEEQYERGQHQFSSAAVVLLESPTKQGSKRKQSQTDMVENERQQPRRSRTRAQPGSPPPPRPHMPPQTCPRGGVSVPGKIIINQHISSATEEAGDANISTSYSGSNSKESHNPANRKPTTRSSKVARFKSFESAEIPTLDAQTERLIVALASYCESGRNGQSMLDLMDTIVNESQCEEKAIAYADDTLPSLALRCSQAVSVNAASQLVSVICDIQLAAKVHRFVSSSRNQTQGLILLSLMVQHEYTHQKEVYDNHIVGSKAKQWSQRYFDQHISWGTQYALIAGAGSFHLLVLIVASQKRNDLRAILPDEFGDLCANIKDPRDNKVGRAFKETIIPFLSHFRKRHYLKISTMLSRKVRRRMGRIPKELEISDLEASDRFCAAIPSQ